MNLGPVLKRLREQSGLSLREVQRRSSVSPGFLSLLERGEREGVSIEYLHRLCRCYGVTLDSVVSEALDGTEKAPWEIAFDELCDRWEPQDAGQKASFRRELVDLLHLVRQDERSAL